MCICAAILRKSERGGNGGRGAPSGANINQTRKEGIWGTSVEPFLPIGAPSGPREQVLRTGPGGPRDSFYVR